MTIDMIKEKVLTIVADYPVKKIILFGSRAEGTNQERTDSRREFDRDWKGNRIICCIETSLSCG